MVFDDESSTLGNDSLLMGPWAASSSLFGYLCERALITAPTMTASPTRKPRAWSLSSERAGRARPATWWVINISCTSGRSPRRWMRVGVLLRGPDGPTNFQSEEKRRSTSWRWPYLIREGVVREESGFLGHRVDPDPVRGHKSKLG